MELYRVTKASDSTAEIRRESGIDFLDVFARNTRAQPYGFSFGLNGLFDKQVRSTSINETSGTEYKQSSSHVSLQWLGQTDASASSMSENNSQSNEYPDRGSRLEKRVREFFSLGKNWDGDGAEEIPKNAIYASLNFLGELRHRLVGKEPSSAAPGPDGEIVLYWYGLNGYAEVNFDGSGNLSLCLVDEANEVQVIERDAEGISGTGWICGSDFWLILSDFLDSKL